VIWAWATRFELILTLLIPGPSPPRVYVWQRDWTPAPYHTHDLPCFFLLVRVPEAWQAQRHEVAMSHRPDRAEIHRRALRAAAAVASFTAACGAADTTVAGAADAAADASDVAVAAADQTATADAKNDVATAELPAADVAADALADVAGTDAVAPDDASDVALSGDGHGAKPDCTTAPNGPCCPLLGAWCAAEYPADSQAATDCQFGPGFNGSTGCSPWGPPAPPAMARLA
jgi:hypothetical protein